MVYKDLVCVVENRAGYSKMVYAIFLLSRTKTQTYEEFGVFAWAQRLCQFLAKIDIEAYANEHYQRI